MKKNTFYSLLFCAVLGGCAVSEGYGSNSKEIAEAQAGQAIQAPETDIEVIAQLKEINPDATPEQIESLNFGGTDYEIVLLENEILLVDPQTSKIILVDNFDSGSALVNAILEDNQ